MKNKEFCLYRAKVQSFLFWKPSLSGQSLHCVPVFTLFIPYMCYSFDHSSVNHKHTFRGLMHLHHNSLCFVAPHCCIFGHSSHAIFIGRLMNDKLLLVHNPPTCQGRLPGNQNSLCFGLDRVGVSNHTFRAKFA